MITTIISYSIFGLFAGLIARFLVPGPDPMGLIGTILLGVAGSFMGGFAYNFIMNPAGDIWAFDPLSFGGSILGAVVLLILMRIFGLRQQRD